MLKKFIDENNVENIKKDGYLIIDGEKHLILNIQNQPIEVLNANGIYEYVEDTKPEIEENQYFEIKYCLEDNVIHKSYNIKEFEFIEEDFIVEESPVEDESQSEQNVSDTQADASL